jgi:hypothetical protein
MKGKGLPSSLCRFSAPVHLGSDDPPLEGLKPVKPLGGLPYTKLFGEKVSSTEEYNNNLLLGT